MKLHVLLPLGLMCAVAVQAQEVAPLYHYGMPLDIARVVNLSEPQSDQCKVIQASMTYFDSAGQQHSLRYLKLAEVCSSQG